MAPSSKATKKSATKTVPRSDAAAKKKPAAAATSGTHAMMSTLKVNGVMARRDATGHLDSTYAAGLRARSQASAEVLESEGAFLRKSRARDGLAEELGEEAVLRMTTGEDQSDRLQNLEVEEESGGPFVTTSAREEYATGTDASNPLDALREPFPTT